MPSSRSASPTSRASERGGGVARGEHAALALAFKLALAPLLVAQAIATRRRAPLLPEAAGARVGRLDGAGNGIALRLLIAGDSSAAGVGVADQAQAFAGHLVRALGARHPGRIDWTLRARSGLTTHQLHRWLRDEPPAPADVAVVVTGVNDVVGQVGVRRALCHRAALADWLLGTGLARHVAFAPLPPMHEFPLLPQPLRRVLGVDARRHDQALAAWASTRSDVSHAAFELRLGADAMARDGFHPGEPVYRACGEALAAHVAKALAARGLAPSATLAP